MRDAARRGPVEALAAAWAVEGSYWRVFTQVRQARPHAGWAQWAVENWANDEFAAMVGGLTAGLDEAGGHADLGELAEIVRLVYMWEAHCWRSVYDLTGWLA